MKTLSTLSAPLLLLPLSANAWDFGDRVENRLGRRGDRIENRRDRRGGRVDARLGRKGDRFNRWWDNLR